MSKSNSKIDEYEMNLKQIQQTNDILHSIENRLNDVFLNQSPSYKNKIDFNEYIESNRNMSPPNKEFPLNDPSFSNDNNKNLFNSTTKILHPNENNSKKKNFTTNFLLVVANN